MISADRANTTGPIINIEVLKNGFPKYYGCLGQDELQPDKIILCSSLIEKSDELLEKVILVYSTKLIIIKNLNSYLSKYKLNYEDINYIILEGMPNPYSITIDYKYDLKERIFYDAKSYDLVYELVSDLRKKFLDSTVLEDYSDFAFSDVEEKTYPGASIARAGVLEQGSVLCSLKQKRIFDHPGLVFRKFITKTHFSVVCKKEIIIFFEKINSRINHNFSGDLIHIPLKALKNVSLEATGKGMILKYLFNTDRRLELFYDNDSTDQLLKIMSYINSMITR
ncbi:MAG: hypothetical protein K0R50_2760 [Eubacterium sp.]|nr:hypothetical protein [Eubacterium sp.]